MAGHPKVSLDPDSPGFDTADQAADALSKKMNGDVRTTAGEKAGVLFLGADGKFRYSTTIDGRDDNFALAAQVPADHRMAGIVHTHPGKETTSQVFSPNDLNIAHQLKLPSYVHFLNDGSTRKYVPGQSKKHTMPMPGSGFGAEVANGDPLVLPPPVVADAPPPADAAADLRRGLAGIAPLPQNPLQGLAPQ